MGAAIVAIANDAGEEFLREEVGLEPDVSREAVDYRRGPDGTMGTEDDRRYDCVNEVAAVVGRNAFLRMREYVLRDGAEVPPSATNCDAQAVVDGQVVDYKFELPGQLAGMSVRDGIVYLALAGTPFDDGRRYVQGVFAIDPEHPEHPIATHEVDHDKRVAGFARAGDIGYLLRPDGLRLIKLELPAEEGDDLAEVGRIDASWSFAQRIASNGRDLIAVQDRHTIHIYRSPDTLVGTYRVPDDRADFFEIIDVAISGTDLFVAVRESTLDGSKRGWIENVAIPRDGDAPLEGELVRNEFGGNAAPGQLLAVGDDLYVLEEAFSRLTRYSHDEATGRYGSPLHIGSSAADATFASLVVRESTLFIAGKDGIERFDLSKEQPETLGVAPWATLAFGGEVELAVTDNRFFVATSSFNTLRPRLQLGRRCDIGSVETTEDDSGFCSR